MEMNVQNALEVDTVVGWKTICIKTHQEYLKKKWNEQSRNYQMARQPWSD